MDSRNKDMNKIIFWVSLILGMVIGVSFVLYRTTRPVPVIPEPVKINIKDVAYDVPEVDARPGIIDAFFAKRGMPLAGTGEMFVVAADSFGIDWRLLPAISVRESSGGKEACGFNAFGWDSCRGYNFQSTDEAITFVSWRLGESPYYEGKTSYQKLLVYNPPSVVEFYADQVIAIMQMIQKDGN